MCIARIADMQRMKSFEQSKAQPLLQGLSFWLFTKQNSYVKIEYIFNE